MRFAASILAAAAPCLSFGPADANAAGVDPLAVEVRTVALSGWSAPNTRGGLFEDFNFGSISPDGNVAFNGWIQSNTTVDSGIWAETAPGDLGLVAFEAGIAPGEPQANYLGFENEGFRVNDAGQVTFVAEVTGDCCGDHNGLFFGAPGEARNIVRSGRSMPGLPDTLRARVGALPSASLNGDAAWVAPYGGQVDGISVSGSGLWMLSDGEPGNLVTRTGMPVSGSRFSVGSYLGRLVSSPVVNDHGQLAVHASVGPDHPDTIFRYGREEGLGVVVTNGAPTEHPDAPGVFDSFHRPRINNAGQVAFWARTRGNASGTITDGLWVASGEMLAPVTTERQSAPGYEPDTLFDTFEEFSLNGKGHLAFIARVSGPAQPQRPYGVWVADEAGELRLVAADGKEAPGVGAGLTFTNLDDARYSYNSAGELLLFAQLEGDGLINSNDHGLWMARPDGSLRLLVREGEPISVAPGDTRTITSLRTAAFTATGNQDGLSSMLSDSGEALFLADFADSSGGVFVARLVPEPSGLAIFAAGALLICLRRRAPIAAVALLLLALAIPVQAEDLSTVALTGWSITDDPADGVYGDGVRSAPQINDQGDVLSVVDLGMGVDSYAVIVRSADADETRIVAASGQPIPGFEQQFFGRFGATPAFNDSGDVAFIVTPRTPQGGHLSDSDGLWVAQGDGERHLVAREGAQAPDVISGARLVDLGRIGLSDAGRVVLESGLDTNLGNATLTANTLGHWAETESDGLRLLARPLIAAPGYFSGVMGRPYDAAVTSQGRAFVSAAVGAVGSSSGTNRRSALWTGEAYGDLAVVYKGGQSIPNQPAVGDFDIERQLRAADSGHVGFIGSVQFTTASDTVREDGLWVFEPDGALRRVAVEGGPAHGAPEGTVYSDSSFRSFDLNRLGRTAFLTGLAVPGAPFVTAALSSEGVAGESTVVAMEGQHAPGTPANVSFGDPVYSSAVRAFETPAINALGQSVFKAALEGPGINDLNDEGIWAQDMRGELHLIAREGGELEVAPGDVRTIRSLRFMAGRVETMSANAGVNALGQIVFAATFTDQTSGIFVSDKVARMPGDFNDDGLVDIVDFAFWSDNLRSDSALYREWRDNYGAHAGDPSQAGVVPEPSAALLVGACVFLQAASMTLRPHRTVVA